MIGSSHSLISLQRMKNRATRQSHGATHGRLQSCGSRLSRWRNGCPSGLRSSAFLLLLLPCPGVSAQRKTNAALHARPRARASRAAAAYTAESSASPLEFQGNLTVLLPPAGMTYVGLQRQSNCSMTEYYASVGLATLMSSKVTLSTVANYQDYLHTAAGLSTTAGTYPNGCKDQELAFPADTEPISG